MITGGAVPASRYTITGVSAPRHAASRDFAGALIVTRRPWWTRWWSVGAAGI